MTEKTKLQRMAEATELYHEFAKPIERENKQAASVQLDDFNAAFTRVFEGEK